MNANIDRELSAIAATGAPTMAEILDDLDRYRSPAGPTSDEIVAALHESREARDSQLWPPL